MKNLLILFFFLCLFILELPKDKTTKKVKKVDSQDIIGKCFSGTKSFLNIDQSYSPYIKVLKKEGNFYIAQYFYKKRRTIYKNIKKITKQNLFKKKKIACPNK